MTLKKQGRCYYPTKNYFFKATMNHNDKENVLLSDIDMVLIRHMIVYEKEIKKTS